MRLTGAMASLGEPSNAFRTSATGRARVRLACVFAASLAVGAVRAEGLRGAVTGGLGVGQAVLGVRGELGWNQWSASLALAPFPGLNPSNSFAAGLRWSLRPDGSGLGVAAQTLVWKKGGSEPETLVLLALTAHWRWTWGVFALDLGAGPAVSLNAYRLPTQDSDLPRAAWGTVREDVCFGIHTDRGRCGIPLDVELGLGVAF